MTSPLCQRLSCLDTSPIVAAIKAVSRGERPDVDAASTACAELSALTDQVTHVVALIHSGSLSQIEALSLLADEPCPSTQRPGLDRIDEIRGAT